VKFIKEEKVDRKEIENELKIRIGKFLSIFRKDDLFDNTRKSNFFIYVYGLKENYIVLLSEEEKSLLYSPIGFLLEQKEISRKYSSKFIEDKLYDLYHEIVTFDDSNLNDFKILIDDSKLDGYIESLINDLFNLQERKFYVVSEVENIKIRDDQEHKIIDSTIKIMRQENLPYDDKKFQQLCKNLIGKSVIFAKVQACDIYRAKEIALYNFKVSFGLIRLFSPFFMPVLKGSLVEERRSLVCYDERRKTSYKEASLIRNPSFYSASLDNRIYSKLIDAGITKLEKDSSISKAIKNGLYWFGLGLDEEYPSAKLVDFAIVLESVLKRECDQTELRKAIAERGAILLFDRFEERKEAVKKLNKIYDVRSRIVHTGITTENGNIISDAEKYAREALKKLIAKSEEFNGDFAKFIESLDDKKLHGSI